MSGFNARILIGTALLGVLLVVVVNMVPGAQPDWMPAPPPPDILEDETWNARGERIDTTLPKLTSHEELRALITARGVDADSALRTTRLWWEKQGFLGARPLLGISAEESSGNAYAMLDDASLIDLAVSAGALQELASRSLPADPLQAMTWYRQAASKGSVYAMLQLAALIQTLKDEDLERFSASEAFTENLEITRDEINTQDSYEQAGLSWALAAVATGGVPVLEPGVASWIRDQLPPEDSAELATACQNASRLLLKLGAERRSRGQQPFETNPPRIFVGAEPAGSELPCGDRLPPVVDTESCEAFPVVDASGVERSLWVCSVYFNPPPLF